MSIGVCCWSVALILLFFLFFFRHLKQTKWGKEHQDIVDSGEKAVLDLMDTLKDKGKPEAQIQEEKEDREKLK